MSLSESLQRPDGCPDLEDIAAFIDKTLEPEQRPSLIRHFVQCRDCYEIFAGASRYYLDAQAEEDNVVPFSRRKVAVRTGLAAAAVLAVAVGVRSYRASLEQPISGTAALVTPSVAQTVTGVWKGPDFRGLEEERGALDERHFSLGVEVVNLQAGLAANDRVRADGAVVRVYNLLKKESFITDSILKAYEDLRREVSSTKSLQELSPAAAQAASALQENLDSPYFELGRWTEAGFLAARARDSQFFESREGRRFPGWILRHEKSQEGKPIEEQDRIAPEVLSEIRAVQDILEEGPPSTKDGYAELESHLRRVLELYYSDGRFESF